MRMELKVCVDGVQRIICGVTDKTTCQEVVIALAQAMGRTGRYSLKEKFKEYERSVTPSEHLLESLEKYGQHAREVQLILHHIGPSLVEDTPSFGAGASLKKFEVGAKNQASRRVSAMHRQSLPPLCHMRLHTEPSHAAEVKGTKHKSFTLMEEARGWLGSLGRSGRFQRTREQEKGSDMKTKVKVHSPVGISGKHVSTGASQERGGLEFPAVTTQQKRESFFCGLDIREREMEKNENTKSMKFLDTDTGAEEQNGSADNALRALLRCQQARLHELQVQINSADILIHKLEEEHQQEQKAFQRAVDDEEDQLQYWENELRAEEAYEQDLQQQFLEMKLKAAECKAKLEEYKFHLQGLGESQNLNLIVPQGVDSGGLHSPIREDCQGADEEFQQARKRTETPNVGDSHLSLGQILSYQTMDTGPSAPDQLRKHWARNAIFRGSEVTMNLSSTRV